MLNAMGTSRRAHRTMSITATVGITDTVISVAVRLMAIEVPDRWIHLGGDLMAQKGGKGSSFWDNPFGGMFDFNRDGREDFGEQWIAMKIFEECTKKDESPRDYGFQRSLFDHNIDGGVDISWREYCEDGSAFDIDPGDYETEEEYEEALNAAKFAWRDTCEDSFELGVDPDDYETEDEYNKALDEVRASQTMTDAFPVSLSFKLEFPGQEALSAISASDYPNKRKYDAAYHLCDVKQGTAYIPDDSSPEKEIARCEFILYSNTTAAKYLTVFDGFLFAQAVKENFTLPIEVPEEDKKVITHFDDLFMELAEEDIALAVKVWNWCIKEFGAYWQYMANDWMLYNGILSSSDEYPPTFMELVVSEMSEDPNFCKGVLEENPQFPSVAKYIGYALECGRYNVAVQMFRSAVANSTGKGKDFEGLIEGVILYCSNWNELETMEAFKIYILPLIAQMNDKRIQRLFPKFKDKVDSYIYSVESSEEKYQYARRFAWRRKRADGSKYGINPLDYETEAEYNSAISQEKHAWRRWHTREAERYGLDLTAYETEEAFEIVVEVERKKEQTAIRKKRQEQREALELRHAEQVKRDKDDPQIDSDKTVYTFCGVSFTYGGSTYYYRTEDHSLAIGDLVIVPVGHEEKETVAEIVTVEQHRRKTAPYPVDKVKFIKGRYMSEAENPTQREH